MLNIFVAQSKKIHHTVLSLHFLIFNFLSSLIRKNFNKSDHNYLFQMSISNSIYYYYILIL